MRNNSSNNAEIVSNLKLADEKIIDMICTKAKLLGKRVLVISDFDGTLAYFDKNPYNVLIKSEKGFKEKLLKSIKKLENARIPLFVLTAGSLKRFSDKKMFGEELNFNAICLKGNEAKLTLNREQASKFLLEWDNQKGYKIDIKYLERDKVRITIDPEDLLKIGVNNPRFQKELEKKLEPFEFFIENLDLLIHLHPRGLVEKHRELVKKGEKHIIEIDSNNTPIFENLKKYPKISLFRKNKDDIEVKNSKNESFFIDVQGLIDYAKDEFDKAIKKEFGDRLVDRNKQLTEKEILEGRAVKTKDVEVADIRIVKRDKAKTVNDIIEMFGGKDKVLPIYFGDAIGKTPNGMLEDDEVGIIETKKLGGVGIAVLVRDKNQPEKELSEREKIKTVASYKLTDCNSVLNFTNQLASKMIEKDLIIKRSKSLAL